MGKWKHSVSLTFTKCWTHWNIAGGINFKCYRHSCLPRDSVMRSNWNQGCCYFLSSVFCVNKHCVFSFTHISMIKFSVSCQENITDHFGKVCNFWFSLIWRLILLPDILWYNSEPDKNNHYHSSRSICSKFYPQTSHYQLLGSSGGVVNSLDFWPASLKSLGCFYFWCILSSQWKAVTVNLQILHCQL